MATELAQLTGSQGKCGPEVVDHFSVHLVARTLLVNVVHTQVAHLLELLERHLDRLLEDHPDDRLGEGWSGQRAQIGPEVGVLGQQFGGIARFGQSYLNGRRGVVLERVVDGN